MERLKALEIFKAVADHGSFTKAADAANIGVPSVSRAVQDLETLLGVQLLKRTTRKVSLTSIGHTVLEHATGILSGFEDLAQVSNDIALDVAGDLRLEVPALFGMGRLAPILADFMHEYPKVRVDTRIVDNNGETLGDLADISIVVGRTVPSSFVARSLDATRFGVYASPMFLSGVGMPKHPDEVRSEHCMAVAGGPYDSSWPLVHSSTGECSTVLIGGAFRTNCPNALMLAAIDGMGMAFLPEHTAGLPESRGELVRVLCDWQAPQLDTQLLYRSRRNQPLRVRKLIDRLVSGFSGRVESQSGLSSPYSFLPTARVSRTRAQEQHALLAA